MKLFAVVAQVALAIDVESDMSSLLQFRQESQTESNSTKFLWRKLWPKLIKIGRAKKKFQSCADVPVHKKWKHLKVTGSQVCKALGCIVQGAGHACVDPGQCECGEKCSTKKESSGYCNEEGLCIDTLTPCVEQCCPKGFDFTVPRGGGGKTCVGLADKVAEPVPCCPPVCAIFCENGNIPDENGCDTCQCKPFNCYTKEVWTQEKQEWCCENEGLGCQPPRTCTEKSKNCPIREATTCLALQLGCDFVDDGPLQFDPIASRCCPDPCATSCSGTCIPGGFTSFGAMSEISDEVLDSAETLDPFADAATTGAATTLWPFAADGFDAATTGAAATTLWPFAADGFDAGTTEEEKPGCVTPFCIEFPGCVKYSPPTFEWVGDECCQLDCAKCEDEGPILQGNQAPQAS